MSEAARRGVVVTGPPRSGTSATTRLLHLAGLGLCVRGDRVGGGHNNPTGHWESKTVLAVNNRLLDAAGTRWWCPPAIGDAIGLTEAITDAVNAFRGVHPDTPWLCKDPRFALTLPFWRRVLGDDIVVVVVLRRPDEVVASLQRTWPLATDHAAALWARYVLGAFAVTRDVPVVIVRFPELLASGTTSAEQLRVELASCGVSLGPLPAEEWAQFVRRPSGAAEAVPELPAHAWRLWDSLNARDAGAARELIEDGAVEAVLAPLRAELRAGRPLDVRPAFARAGDSVG